MKLTKFYLMKRKGDNMMHSVNDDLLEGSEDEMEVLIFEISDDSEGELLILIFEIYLVESSEEDLVDEEVRYTNEKISKKL
jgi:hypothetical protein